MKSSKKKTVASILKAATKNKLTDVVVVGLDACGNIWALSSDPNVAEVNLLLDRAKLGYLQRLMDGVT